MEAYRIYKSTSKCNTKVIGILFTSLFLPILQGHCQIIILNKTTVLGNNRQVVCSVVGLSVHDDINPENIFKQTHFTKCYYYSTIHRYYNV